MEYYPIGKARSKERQSPLDASEATGYRSVLGGLQWASHTRSDHSAECSRLQGKRGSPTVEDMRDANSLLRRCKDSASSAYLSFRKQSTAPKRILVFPDASLNSVSKKDKNGNKTEQKRTQAGWLILLTDDTETLDTDNAHVLNWVTRKVTRVSKCTSASEAVARTGAVEDAIRIAGWLEELNSVALDTKSLICCQE